MPAREVVIGLHLYQPPRKAFHRELSQRSSDPLGIDWTERIYQECYRRLVEENIFSLASFDIFGTLRGEIRKLSPEHSHTINQRLREHGVGEPYLHPLLPDLSRLDKEILIGAGLVAFRRATGVAPKIFWPPETALDNETLTVLAEYGYQGVICAPEQIQCDRSANGQPVRIRAGGNSILALPFDGDVSRELAFSDKLNADQFVAAYLLSSLAKLDKNSRLVAWTDGETFGHHSKQGDLFLQYLLFHALPNRGVIPVPANELLRANGVAAGRLIQRTAWSCPHGDLRRWHGACGCGGGDLSWKEPFYSGLHSLNGFISTLVQAEIGSAMKDQLIEDFPLYLENPGGRESSQHQSLLSAKAASLAAVTSCGTFFDNPFTSGQINFLFAIQALYHLSDAGLANQAEQGRLILRDHLRPSAHHFRSSPTSPFSEILR